MRERDRTTENATGNGARTMKASEFKAKCLALMDEIAESGEEIVITKQRQAPGQLDPCEAPRRAPWGGYRDIIQIHGDVISPVDLEWEAESDPDGVLNP